LQFKFIDFGLALFDELLAQAAGGYESEVSLPACLAAHMAACLTAC
jgi:hypothetical protein